MHAELANNASNMGDIPSEVERAAKRIKIDDPASTSGGAQPAQPDIAPADKDGVKSANGEDSQALKEDTRKGLAPIKKEFLVEVEDDVGGDDEAEGPTEQTDARGRGARDDRDRGGKQGRKKKQKGQNTERTFGHFDDAIRLCNSRVLYPEFSPRECRLGDRCKMSHDLRKYLEEGRREDVEAFGGKCPVFEAHGWCPSGWKCRFVKSHMQEVEHDDGRKELVLVDNTPQRESAADGTHKPTSSEEPGKTDESRTDEPKTANGADGPEDQRPGVYNTISSDVKFGLSRKRLDFTKADEYIKWLGEDAKIADTLNQSRKDQSQDSIEDLRAKFVDPPFKPSEKRRLYFGPETPTLAPLTTQGNLPFRRLCVELGAQLTYSEMAMGLPLVQGAKADWTLMKAHESEIAPPRITRGKVPIFEDYDNSRDLRFGAQISAHQPWVAIKSADVLNRYVPHLRLIDLNCGCPIDMVFKSGAGSALMAAHGKLERMIRGMNVFSGEIPVTAKIRTGVKNNRPTAYQVIEKLAFGSREHRERLGAPGCAAVTLHGRSREQRYTKRADWSFIADCAALIKSYNEQKADITDTIAEPDPSTLPNAKDGRMYFLGNGDCYSHVDYNEHIEKARVDSVMIGRGALVKPWLFEEIEKGQYLDKSASERLTYVEKFARYGLEAWGSDEVGVGLTRRFLLEWLSFAHRYVPIGLLEYLPPALNDRPPAYRGRNDLETLMASPNYKDWIKISEMYLGPVHPGFKFQPKHKSNAYEAEG